MKRSLTVSLYELFFFCSFTAQELGGIKCNVRDVDEKCWRVWVMTYNCRSKIASSEFHKNFIVMKTIYYVPMWWRDSLNHWTARYLMQLCFILTDRNSLKLIRLWSRVLNNSTNSSCEVLRNVFIKSKKSLIEEESNEIKVFRKSVHHQSRFCSDKLPSIIDKCGSATNSFIFPRTFVLCYWWRSQSV